MALDHRKQRTRQHAAGVYQSGMRRDGFDFTLGADSVAKIVDNNNYRIDATVHMGRILRTDIGRTVAYAEESMDTTGGFGRKDGQVDYADGTATQRWRGLDDTGACFDRTLGAEHGWVNRETTLTHPCGGMWPG